MASTSLISAIPGYVARTYRPAVTAQHGMVSSGHPLASLSGLRVLLDGGNAVDAIVAMASTLNVVEPWMSGALGVGQMLVYQSTTDRVAALDFGGRSPAAASPELFVGENSIPIDDVRAPLVPANLGGWQAALERYGTMDRGRAFRDAIDYAANGHPLTEGGAAWITLNRARLARRPTTRRIFVNDSDATAGARFVQSDLAETYRQFVAEGAPALYSGSVGQEVVKFCQAAGGVLSAADLAACTPRWTEPLSITYRGYQVLTMPSPSMGIQILLTLKLMEGYDTAALGHNSANYLHTLAEAIKVASALRTEYTMRPAAPIADLLSDASIATQRSSIDAGRAAPSQGERWRAASTVTAGRSLDPGLTTYLCAADRDGNVVSFTQSIGNAFGCAAVAGGTGLLLNDFGWWFDLDPDSPNVLAPNKPVEQCLSPCLVFRDGELVLAIGTPGGHGIMQSTAQMLLNVLDFGMNIQEALEAPRIRLFDGTHLDVEDRIPESVRQRLEILGHAVTVLPSFFWGVGGGQGLARIRGSGALVGGADPRREGYALGW